MGIPLRPKLRALLKSLRSDNNSTKLIQIQLTFVCIAIILSMQHS